MGVLENLVASYVVTITSSFVATLTLAMLFYKEVRELRSQLERKEKLNGKAEEN